MSLHIYVNLVRSRVVTRTSHYINTCVKLTIVTHLSFSERIAIANLSLIYFSLKSLFQFCSPYT